MQLIYFYFIQQQFIYCEMTNSFDKNIIYTIFIQICITFLL